MSKRTDSAVESMRYVEERLKAHSNSEADEQKLHDLLYLVQREGYAIFQEPILDASFVSHPDGPRCVEMDSMIIRKSRLFHPASVLSERTILVLNSVLEQYGTCSHEKLLEIIHKDDAWHSARNNSNETFFGIIGHDLLEQDSRKINVLRSLWYMDHNTFFDPAYSYHAYH